MFRIVDSVTSSRQWETDFDEAEHAFAELLISADLDHVSLRRHARSLAAFEEAVDVALAAAHGHLDASAPIDDDAHRFLHRVLYRINRLTLFWYDDLHNYRNERSAYLQGLRDRIENPWQEAEQRAHALDRLRGVDVAAGLRSRTALDLDPPASMAGVFFRDRASDVAYQRLLAIASLDGLVEASQLSRTLGGVSNPIQSTMTRLLVEEYGGGRLAKKHSSYFRAMLETLEMSTTPEAYFDVVPWEVLSTINHSFLLSDRKRYFLRYVGGLLYTETSVPAAFRCYSTAATRLALAPDARTYWDLHIKEDARHGPWMLNDVALPLVELYPADAWELLLGYDQQRRMSGRAADATARSAASAECAVLLRT